jgi:hypothetical protein
MKNITYGDVILTLQFILLFTAGGLILTAMSLDIPITSIFGVIVGCISIIFISIGFAFLNTKLYEWTKIKPFENIIK